ncbi:hypothetical protein [Methylobacterium fujisawaense]|uniref:hypothetical protein n=1 Tax=Methylobacterium fujisawaense TaxID=107400 RepID=UPI0036F9BA5E
MKPNHAPGYKHADVPADPTHVLGAVKSDRWVTQGDPAVSRSTSRLLARRDGGPWTELHVVSAGTIYKRKTAYAEKGSLAA